MQGGIFGHLCVLNWLENVPALENLEIGNTSKELQRAPIYTSCLHSICFGLLRKQESGFLRWPQSSWPTASDSQNQHSQYCNRHAISSCVNIRPQKRAIGCHPLGFKANISSSFPLVFYLSPNKELGPWNRQHPCDPTPPLSPTQELWWSNYPVYHRALTPNLDLP